MAKSLNIEGDVASVAEYVASLPATRVAHTLSGGDAAAGQVRYATVCSACHGPQAQGDEAMRAPTLVHQADWYMLKQLEKFKRGMRGADPRDIQGSQMRAMVATLENEQAMRDVIAYIRTLAK
jgi:cytochrome c553